MSPHELRDLVAAAYAEIRPQLFAGSWHCREIACIALGADRARGGHGCFASGELRLPDGNTTPHVVFICGDPAGSVIDGFEGQVRLSKRADLELTVVGISGVRVKPPGGVGRKS
jgi:hypothetical protein